MIIERGINNFIRYIPTRGTKIPSAPKMTTPIALIYFSKLLVDFTRATTLSTLNKLTNRYIRRNSNKKMKVITRQYTINDLYTELFCNLSYKLSNTQTKVACKYFVTILGYPYKMITMVIDSRMAFCITCHTVKITEV